MDTDHLKSLTLILKSMTKRFFIPVLFILLVGLIIYLNYQNKTQINSLLPSPTTINKDLDQIQINGKKVIGLSSGKEKEELESIKIGNQDSSEWRENLEETLRKQSDHSLKNITFKTVDSFVWAHEGVVLFVESLIVTITNENNENTTFRVLVDSQTGKILQNWDRPVYDPANPRDQFKIQIDPRYAE